MNIKHQAILINKLSSLFNIITVILLTLLIGCQNNEPQEKIAQTTLEEFIKPPLPGKEVQFETFKINSQTENTITYSKTGSKVIIPAHSFVKSNGESITGEVEVQYREFHRPSEIVLSGIPMHFDDGDQHFEFESGGMLEIQAFSDGEALKLADNKFIDVQMISKKETADDYNLYYLDTIQQNWQQKGKVDTKVKSLENKVRKTNSGSSKEKYPIEYGKREYGYKVLDTYGFIPIIERYGSIPPKLPRKANPDQMLMSIKLDTTKFPDLAYYKGIQFELPDEESKKLNSDLKFVEWDHKYIQATTQEGTYIVVLKKATKEFKFKAFAVVPESTWEETKYMYGILSQADALGIDISDTRSIRNYILSLSDKSKKDASDYANKIVQKKTEKTISRNFTISSLGVWNCDRPIPPGQIQILAKYNLDNQEYNFSGNLYLADKVSGTVLGSGFSNSAILIRSTGKYIGLIVLDEEHVGIISPDQLQGDIFEHQGNYTFNIEKHTLNEGLEVFNGYMHI